MEQYRVSKGDLERFSQELRRREHVEGTVKKYCRDVAGFTAWLEGRPVTAEAASRWKAHLLAAGLAPVTVNSKLSALNSFFRFAGWADCQVKFLKVQRRVFRDQGRELNRKSGAKRS